MKNLKYVYAPSARELCAEVSARGITPIAILPAGSNQRVVAYYWCDEAEAVKAMPEPQPEAPSVAGEASKPAEGEVLKKAAAPKPAATRTKAGK